MKTINDYDLQICFDVSYGSKKYELLPLFLFWFLPGTFNIDVSELLWFSKETYAMNETITTYQEKQQT